MLGDTSALEKPSVHPPEIVTVAETDIEIQDKQQSPPKQSRLRSLFSRKFAGLWVLLLIPWILGMVLIFLGNKLVPALQVFLEKVGELGVWGYIIMIVLQAIVCIPPLPGFSVLLLANGFTFGFPLGFIPLYIGTLLGGVIAFFIARHVYIRPYKSNLLNLIPELGAIERAVLSGNYWVAQLIRLAPYSYPLMNFLFASTGITFYRFLAITLVANFKYLINCYVGGYLRSLTLGLGDPIQAAVVSAMAAFGISIGIFLFVYVRKVLARYAAQGAEEIDLTRGEAKEDEVAPVVEVEEAKGTGVPDSQSSLSESVKREGVPSGGGAT
ncbi:hypothetical protein BJ742DRAFT_825065 [Cladochytrium replicatum]|nr:hypothetical protein BJ742DRAFT_825065 [Cladochytrium replicatum]